MHPDLEQLGFALSRLICPEGPAYESLDSALRREAEEQREREQKKEPQRAEAQ
jgi:hypothetical protein